MSDDIRKRFQRRVSGAERSILMTPFNVVMVASIRGHIDTETLSGVLKKLRKRHPLLASRVDDDKMSFTLTCNDKNIDFENAILIRDISMENISRALTVQ